jgi:two-component system, NtrC family, response regulator AtoC
MAKRKILIVEDEKLALWALKEKLTGQGYDVSAAQSGEEAIEKYSAEQPDLILLDITLPGIDGLTVLQQIRKTDSETAIIMVTGKTDLTTAVTAVKYGADNYIGKPFQLDELSIQVEKALQGVRLKREIKSVHDERTRQYSWKSIVGKSSAIEQLLEHAKKIMGSHPTTMLLLGESGTGKDLLAKVMHHESSRHDMPFIEVNCNAIPENLLESELMGYEKGAFTDAKSTKKGLFELADGGTIFLNEIGDMPLHLQVKLLQILENRRFRRVGGTHDIEVDVCIQTATNKDLPRLIQLGSFREDLYYRLQVLPLSLPPLRERGDDVLLLADFFLTRFNARCKKAIQGISENAKKKLLAYKWPGNIRELSNVIERAVILSSGELRDGMQYLMEDFLPRELAENGFFNKNGKPTPQFALPKNGCQVEDVEKELIIQALDRCNNNQTHAAQLVGLSRDALRYRMQKYGMLKERE